MVVAGLKMTVAILAVEKIISNIDDDDDGDGDGDNDDDDDDDNDDDDGDDDDDDDGGDFDRFLEVRRFRRTCMSVQSSF